MHTWRCKFPIGKRKYSPSNLSAWLILRSLAHGNWIKSFSVYGGRPKLHAQLARVDFDQAMTVALLASVSSELSVNEYNSAKAERLETTCQELPCGHRRNPQAGSGRSRSQEEWQGRLAIPQSAIMFTHVRALPIVAAEAVCRRIFRLWSVERGLESSLQYRPDQPRPCNSSTSEGTGSSTFAHALGLDPALGKRPFHFCEHDKREVGDGCHETSVPRPFEVPSMFDSRRWFLRMEEDGYIQAAILL